MIIYLVGTSCVGKTTIGKILAANIGYSFLDLDEEVEKYYQKSIERIQNECLTMNGFRKEASIVLDYLFSKMDNTVIAGTASGLMDSYLQVYKKHKKNREIISIHIKDKPENILSRLTFFDVDSKPLKLDLEETEKKKYLKEIIVDYNYFKDSYKRADIEIEINNLCLDDISNLIMMRLSVMNKVNNCE